jgi:tRNA threonylcarbamoyladenosine biosynthesis protein TsaE
LRNFSSLRHYDEMKTMILHDLAATEALARHIATRARQGDAILLEGPLGAGKSAFCRAFLRAAAHHSTLEVPSPSFTLVQSYQTTLGPVHHFDLWRLDGPAGMIELGWEELQADIVLVEWPDRLGALRPSHALSLTLALNPDESRHATLQGWEDRL